MRQPRGAEHGLGEPEARQPRRQGLAASERRAGLAHRRRGLDAVAALRRRRGGRAQQHAGDDEEVRVLRHAGSRSVWRTVRHRTDRWLGRS